MAVGLAPVKLPVLTIEPVPCEVDEDVPDVAVVLSAHAVAHGGNVLSAWGSGPEWLAVGKATARALSEVGVHARRPARSSSEGLLALDVFEACEGLHVGILCGESPRPLLAEALTGRGALVSEYPVYRRLPLKPKSDYHAQLSSVSAVVVSSVDGLQAFHDLWNEARGADSVMLCVNAERIADKAHQLGFTDVRVSAAANGAGLGQELVKWLGENA